jgi:diacylglycerol O-acyltransferase / wax synthase
MKQLSALDNMFLDLETQGQSMHVASLGIYDPATAPEGKVRFKQILAHYRAWVEKTPIFQRRLVKVPLGLDLPYFVDAGAIDLEYHVRHIALPSPGDWRQLMIQIARLHSRPLDLARPLWETYVIEGLDNIDDLPPGCFAIYCKMHHALVDGETGSELIRIQHDLSPVVRPIDQQTVIHADREPSLIELMARTLPSRGNRLVRSAKTLGSLVGLGVRAGAAELPNMPALLRQPEVIAERVKSLFQSSNPHTRFSEKVSAHRIVTGTPLPLGDFQAIRTAVPGATINDIFLALTGGAVRRYLHNKNELPAQTLHASVPVSVRGEKKSIDAGNQVASAFAPLGTDIADPLARIAHIHAAMEATKSSMASAGPALMREVMELLPQMPIETVLRKLVTSRASVTVSNVRGPSVPLYFAGARLVRFLPVSIALDGVGLNVTGFSYDAQLWICVVCCRAMMPDPDNFTAALRASFDEMCEAAKTKAGSASAPVAPRKKRKTHPAQ